MAIFKDERVDYLEEERKKLWAQISHLEEKSRLLQEESQAHKQHALLLEEALQKKTTDYEADAKAASIRASEFETASSSSFEAINGYLTEANSKLGEIRTIAESATKVQPELKQAHELTLQREDAILQALTHIQELQDEVTSKVKELNEIYANRASYVEKITQLEELYAKGNDLTTKIDQAHKITLGKSNEINTLYLSIVGYTDKDDRGEPVNVPGLKDKLQDQYSELEKNAATLSFNIVDIESSTEAKYKAYMNAKDKEFATTIETCKVQYENIVQRLKELLPEALTKGLSAAYYEKRKAEDTASRWLTAKFMVGIIGMILVSLIPFIISIYFLKNEIKTLDQVIHDIPRIVAAILPLYVPVLWLAYSANKGLNLSKRLIEEYTHKEVLSKTFEGLSQQISEIDDEDISAELRVKLLYNILEVNSENPGKLITDYNKADHPLMDALEKSVKLGNAIDKLAEIPGLNKLAPILEKKAKSILEENKKKADEGLEAFNASKKSKSKAKDQQEEKEEAEEE